MTSLRSFALLLFVTVSIQAQTRYIGIPTQQIRNLGRGQDQPNWCWASSAQLILNYFGDPESQTQIVTQVRGHVENVGGTDDDISAALSYHGLDSFGRPINLNSLTFYGPPPIAAVFGELEKYRPIMVTFKIYNSPESHSVVITAASYDDTPTGRRLRTIIFHDSAPGAQGSTGGWQELRDGQIAGFFEEVRRHWLVMPK
jgi:hypothetical protein